MNGAPLREWRGLPPGLRDQTPRVRPALLTPDGYCSEYEPEPEPEPLHVEIPTCG